MPKIYETIEDVLTDDLFIAWYAGQDLQKVKEWENRLGSDPVLRTLAAGAAGFMNQLSITEKTVSGQQITEALQRLNTRLDQTESIPVVQVQPGSYKKRWWMAAAAVAVLFLGAAAFYFYSAPSVSKKSAYVTPYGQLQKYELPDGSIVTLNANSTVKISDDWNDKKDREVWLKGEAFFKVRKTTAKNRFIVHTNDLDVIVTGTQFNVINRGNKTSVLLTEGSVTILAKDGKKIMMKPGDFVEFDNNVLQQKEVNPENVTAWTDRKMVFDFTPMEKAAKMIEEIYGVEIELADDKAKGIVLAGVMPNDNLDVLLQSIESSQNCIINKDGARIIITGK